jgi:glycosyltransferase involved in cell wall biosynthesis
MKIINLSDLDPSWCWLRDELPNTTDTWHHQSSLSIKLPKALPKKDSFARLAAAYKATSMSNKAPSLLVSHGPRPTFYGASASRIFNPKLPHLAYSFNFTDLPVGFQHKAMVKAYQRVNRFVVYTAQEKGMYADYFDISPELIDIIPWAVRPPEVNHDEPPIVTGSYICAIGSQGRDYETLFKTIKTLKDIKLVLVASPESINNLEIPENVKVFTNIPLKEAQNILMHSKFMVLPLRDSQVPCGIVTIVYGMFLKKAVLVTRAEGVQDYINDNVTGLFYEAKNTDDFSNKITQLWESESTTNNLANQGYAFAHEHCTEQTVINYFTNYLEEVKATIS